MKTLKLIAISWLALGFFTSCSNNPSDVSSNLSEGFPVLSSWQSLNAQAEATIKVINQFNEPIANAKILIGSAQGVPFKNNFLTTSKTGMVSVSAEWTTAEHVTADAIGYIRQTLIKQKPGTILIKMNAAYLAQKAVVQGQVTQLPVINGDKQIDVALVMPALKRTDLMNFDLGTVLSPFSDILSVATYKAPVPSNVSLPTQKESYIFNLTVSKPQYRFFNATLGPKRVYTVAGRFPFKAVVDELRGGTPFYDVINYFTMMSGGIRDITLVGPTTQLDIPGNELNFNTKINISSPHIGADEIYLAMAANELNSQLIPTDLKKVPSNTATSLVVMDSHPKFVMGVIKKQNEFMEDKPGSDRLSMVLLPYKANQKINMLPLAQDPSVSFNNGYRIALPQAPTATGINALAVSAVISDISEIQNGDKKITNLLRKWEILGQTWPTSIHLPNWPLDTTAKRRIEINFIGSSTQKAADLGDSLVKATTHVSHASTDY